MLVIEEVSCPICKKRYSLIHQESIPEECREEKMPDMKFQVGEEVLRLTKGQEVSATIRTRHALNHYEVEYGIITKRGTFVSGVKQKNLKKKRAF
jgi:hypothetical protein